MTDFPDCFLLVFGQLAVGGLLSLSVPPFHAIERGFFKSSAAVFLTAALVLIAGRLALIVREGVSVVSWPGLDLAVWIVFGALTGLYLRSLWGDPFRLRARAYAAALATGLIALATSAARFRLAPLVSVETLLYPLEFATAAAVLGAATTGMLLGHWYLIDPGMSLLPLQRVLRFFVVALSLHVGLILLSLGVLALAAAPATAARVAALWSDHRPLLLVRLLLGPVPAFVLAAMIRHSLAIPQTMAATGLFYIAVLAVTVGEILGRFVLYRTSLPL
jgi:hypothetical protein